MKDSASWLLYKQLELIDLEEPEIRVSKLTLKSRIGRIWKSLFVKQKSSSELRIWHTSDGAGNIWWSGYDSRTGQSIEQLSEAEMRIWIERRQHQCLDFNIATLKKTEFDWYWYMYGL